MRTGRVGRSSRLSIIFPSLLRRRPTWERTRARRKQRGRASRNRIVVFITVLNLILLVGLLYKTFGQALTPSGGVAVTLANETFTPMIDMSLQYPGGKVDLPRIDPQQGVGLPIADVREFDATLTFKDKDNHEYKETFHIKPLGENLIRIYVQPVLEESLIKTADGKEETLLKASKSRVRILTSYQAPLSYN